jgi:hypothetical protein
MKKALWTECFPEQRKPSPSSAASRQRNSPRASKTSRRSNSWPKRRSAGRAKLDKLYNARVRQWLTEPGNRECRVSLLADIEDFPVTLPATQCHHRNGRGWCGELLMEESLWVPVSAKGHDWIDRNRDEARRLGLLALKGQWNRAPK